MFTVHKTMILTVHRYLFKIQDEDIHLGKARCLAISLNTWEWNNTMLLHQQKQNRSPQNLPHHNRPFLLPHQPFQYN